jgi:hypothetical protein
MGLEQIKISKEALQSVEVANASMGTVITNLQEVLEEVTPTDQPV